MRWIACIPVAAACAILTACGGRGSSSSLPSVAPAGPHADGTLRVTVTIPRPLQGSLHPAFIVAQTSGMDVALTPSGATQPSIDLRFDVSPASQACTTSSGARTCTLAIPAVGGTTYAVRFASYDTAPVNGVIPSGAKLLAVGTATATIAAGQLNVLRVTMNGTPASVAVATASQGVLAGAATTVSLATTIVTDAAGNTIVGAYSSPITVAVSDSGAHTALSIDGGATKSATVSLSSSTDASNLNAYYDGGGSAGYVATVTFSGAGVASAASTLNRFTVAGTPAFGTPRFTAGAPSTALKKPWRTPRAWPV